MWHNTILKLSLAIASLSPLNSQAQDFWNNFNFWNTDWRLQTDDSFRHLDVSVTAGTTGIGIDLATPVNDFMRIRMGGTFMPHFEKEMNFGVEVGNDPNLSNQRFNKMAETLKGLTGYTVDKSIDMIGTPEMNNFKLLVDVYPFRNKKFHVTAGFYLGSSNIAKAVNTQAAMNSLVATSMYNYMYKNAVGNHGIATIPYNKSEMEILGNTPYVTPELAGKFADWGMITIPIGEIKGQIVASEDIYWDHDCVNWNQVDNDAYDEYVYGYYDEQNGVFVDPGAKVLPHNYHKGDIRYHKGDVIYADGDTYRMMPDEDNMVRANAKANAFKPYLGFGYSTPISSDKRTTLTVDAGMLFWGGAPKLTTRTPIPGGMKADGTPYYVEVDMCRDLRNVRGKAGDYVDLIKGFPIYPIFNISISQRIF